MCACPRRTGFASFTWIWAQWKEPWTPTTSRSPSSCLWNKKMGLLSVSWWAPAHMPKFMSSYCYSQREDKCATNTFLYLCWRTNHSEQQRKHQTHRYGAIHQSAHPSWPLEITHVWLPKAQCAHLRPTVDLSSINLNNFLSFYSDIHPKENLLMA